MKNVITPQNGAIILALGISFTLGMMLSTAEQTCPADKEVEKKAECTLARARYTDASLAAFVAEKMPVEPIESCQPIFKWRTPSCASAEEEAWDGGWSQGYSEGIADGWKTTESLSDDKNPDRTILEPRNFRNSKSNANL